MIRGIVLNQIHGLKKKDRRLLVLYLAGFILSISTNVTAYINSSFIENYVRLEYVGLFFMASNIATFFGMLYFPYVIKKLNNLLTSKLMMLVNIIAAGFLVFLNSPFWIFSFFIIMWVSANLLWINMDIFVESFTNNKNTGRVRAIFFTTMNLGWIVSPTIATNLVLDGNNYRFIYLVSVVFLMLFYLLINRYKNILNRIDIIYQKMRVKQIIKIFWQDRNLRGLYFSSFFLNLFFGLVVVYMPIYLHNEIGFSWPTLGAIFSIMLIPFIIIEIPAGYLADKYWGEIEMMNAGFIILTLSLFVFYTINVASFALWAMVLFFSRVGAALIEAMRESRFFKIVDVEHVSHINFLRTSYPLGYLTAAGLGAIIISFYEVNYIFLFLAIIFLASFYFVNIIKDSK